jgi:hypothetical protein
LLTQTLGFFLLLLLKLEFGLSLFLLTYLKFFLIALLFLDLHLLLGLLSEEGLLLLLLLLGLNSLAHLHFMLLLQLGDHRQVILGVASFSLISFLVILVVNLSVVFVLAAAAALLTLHPALLQVAQLLEYEAAVLSV